MWDDCRADLLVGEELDAGIGKDTQQRGGMTSVQAQHALLTVYVPHRRRDAEPRAGIFCELGTAGLEEDFHSVEGCDDGLGLEEMRSQQERGITGEARGNVPHSQPGRRRHQTATGSRMNGHYSVVRCRRWPVEWRESRMSSSLLWRALHLSRRTSQKHCLTGLLAAFQLSGEDRRLVSLGSTDVGFLLPERHAEGCGAAVVGNRLE